RRTDEDQLGPLDRLGEVGALAEKTVARMNGLRAGGPRGFDEGLDAEIAPAGSRGADRQREVRGAHVQARGVGLGIDRDRLEPLRVAGADDPERDLAAICDQYPGDAHAG